MFTVNHCSLNIKITFIFFFFYSEFVNYGLLATYLGANCVYIVFIARSMHDVINNLADINWDTRIYIAFFIIPVLIMGQVCLAKKLNFQNNC